MKKNDLYGLILAGGKSSRMKRDKSTLSFHGIPQRDYLVRLLQKFCSDVFVSLSRNAISDKNDKVIQDGFDVGGPLNGILSAFNAYPEVAWLTVAVDMPLIDDKVIDFLIKNRNTAKAATCFYDSEASNPEPLLTIWECETGKKLWDFYRQGGTSPRVFLSTVDVHMVHIPDATVLKNINTPEEFREMKRMGKKSPGNRSL